MVGGKGPKYGSWEKALALFGSVCRGGGAAEGGGAGAGFRVRVKVREQRSGGFVGLEVAEGEVVLLLLPLWLR